MTETTSILPNGNVLVRVPFTIRRVSNRRRVFVPATPVESVASIVARIGRARKWAAMLEAGEAANPSVLADELGIDRSNLMREMTLASVSPFIVRQLLSDTPPQDLSLAKLWSLKSTVWSEQERALGLP